MVEQVGGSHYKGDYQHWDWAVDVHLGPLEYGATKYIHRWYKKGGLQDLQKALSFVDKMRVCLNENRIENECYHVRGGVSMRSSRWFRTWINSCDVPEVEADLCWKIANWETSGDITDIMSELQAHIKVLEAQAAIAAATRPAPLLPLATA